MKYARQWQRLTLMAAAVLALTPWHASAQESSPAWLPPQAQVDAVMAAHPALRAAQARTTAATATQRALDVGSHEFELSTGLQRRRVRDEMRDYNEWEVQLSRAIRLPDKARLDREIGSSTHAVAALREMDAEHQTARRLLEAWMTWLRSAMVADDMQAQEALLAREQAAMERRVALGDAALRDQDVLQAERAQWAAQVVTARDAALAARQALAVEFPQIDVPLAPPELPQPEPLADGAQSWLARIIQESAEIRIADAEVERLSRVAQRARANRTPDPTVGVRVMSDRGGAERTVGVVLTVPFGTDYRSAMAAGESANALAAEADAADVRRTVEQGAWAAVQAAQSKCLQWNSFTQALAAQTAASTRTRRAWELGEAPLSEHLLAQRSLRQARLAETQARIDALHAVLLVRVDAHELWHSGDAHADAHANADADAAP